MSVAFISFSSTPALEHVRIATVEALTCATSSGLHDIGTENSFNELLHEIDAWKHCERLVTMSMR